MFLSGLANCHIPGLYSLVLSGREGPSNGMRRVFYAGVDCRMPLFDGADFRLKPHNHRQNITLTLLTGDASNVTLKTGFGDHRVWCYKFKSALLNGEFALERMNYENARTVSKPITPKGISLHWSIVHTVVARPMTAWLVEEGELAPPDMERLWSIDHDLKLSSKGLYEPMSAKGLETMWEMLRPSLIPVLDKKERDENPTRRAL